MKKILKKIQFIILLLALFMLLASCGTEKCYKTSYAMGAMVSQTLYGKSAEEAAIVAEKQISLLDSKISYRDINSTVFKLNSEGSALLDEELFNLLDMSLKLSSFCPKAYDITLLPVIKAWGFDTESPFYPDEDLQKAALLSVGYKNIVCDKKNVTLKNGASIDFSACGKGAACATAVLQYKNHLLDGGIVSVGGSIGVFGTKNGDLFSIAVQSPFDSSATVGFLKLTDKFISTSGNYEKYFLKNEIRYCHIFDPSTGLPVQNELASVTVICDDGALSDALSTTCFVLGIKKSLPVLRHYNSEALFVTNNGDIYATSDAKKVFVSEQNVKNANEY